MAAALRRDTKIAVDRLTLRRRIAKAERSLKAGRGVNWRKVRRDV
jgi:hypothetical protein